MLVHTVCRKTQGTPQNTSDGIYLAVSVICLVRLLYWLSSPFLKLNLKIGRHVEIRQHKKVKFQKCKAGVSTLLLRRAKEQVSWTLQPSCYKYSTVPQLKSSHRLYVNGRGRVSIKLYKDRWKAGLAYRQESADPCPGAKSCSLY